MRLLVFAAVVAAALVLPINAQVPTSTPSDKAAQGAPAARSAALATGYVRPTKDERFHRYGNSIFGPVAIARNLAGAGVATWRNSPEEWGDRWPGFGRRVASAFARGAIRNTFAYGLDEAFRFDSSFYRSKNRSVGARISNALVSTVTARRPDGRRVFGFPRVAATYASSIIAYETWYPSRYDYKDGLRNGTISLGFNAAFNLVKEFLWKK